MKHTHIYIIGSKGIPAQYGGFESFVDSLTCFRKDEKIQYHISCIAKEKNQKNVEYNHADCFFVNVPNIGPAKAVYYDLSALNYCIADIEKNHIRNFKIYILACRIGPFIGHYEKRIHELGGQLYVNPDGHEWMRAKWNTAIKKYWKLSERLMIKYADLIICDSKNIEVYIQEQYQSFHPHTCFIAYGANISRSALSDDSPQLTEWYQRHGLKAGEYYLVVGRFVPENNYETMIKEFMTSSTKKSLVLVTNVEKNKFYQKLAEKTGFESDKRIKFVGTVYDQELVKKIRENAFAYLHGHEVGGTNPSLLEALASTRLNLLLDVGFNREVAEDGAFYWTKEKGALAELIGAVEKLSEKEALEKGALAVQRIQQEYEWDKIVADYEKRFMQ